MALRDELRAAIFDAKNKRLQSKVVELFGQEVEIRQPTIAQINKLSQGNDSKVPALVRIMIEYCFVPGTNDKVFESGDAESLASMPTGPWISTLNKAIEELTGVNVEEAEKNSEETD